MGERWDEREWNTRHACIARYLELKIIHGGRFHAFDLCKHTGCSLGSVLVLDISINKLTTLNGGFGVVAAEGKQNSDGVKPHKDMTQFLPEVGHCAPHPRQELRYCAYFRSRQRRTGSAVFLIVNSHSLAPRLFHLLVR
jgi:hypothetical protein